MSGIARRWYVLALSLVKSLESVLGPWLAAGIEPEQLYRASVKELTAEWRVDRKVAEEIARQRGAVDLRAEKARVEAAGAWVTSILDEDYPAVLRRVPSPPPVLYVKGTLPDAPAVAVVGSRKASAYGLAAAEKIATELAEAGVTVVSGFALGIDHAAHRAALSAGGTTIVVLGCGIDICYPRRHATMVPEVVRSGCLISEVPVGTPPLPQHFPMRNRIISGLSLATVVVEAAVNSGSLYTADFALAQGREVLAVPGSIYSPTSQGTNGLLVDGAGPARCAEDVFDTIGLETPERATRRRERLSGREASVLEILAGEPLTVDEVVQRGGMAAPEVSAVMTLLEVKGVVRRGLDQRFMPIFT